jgi:hypothetical protein
LVLHYFNEQTVQHLAAGATGSTLSGVARLYIRVSLPFVWHHAWLLHACKCWPDLACCLQSGSFSSAALNCFPSLQRLTLEHVGLRPGAGRWAAPAQLKHLQVSGLADTLQLAHILHAATDLDTLEMSRRPLDAENAALLAPALRGQTQLRQLQISLTQPECAAMLAPALRPLTGLTLLGLRGSSLGPQNMAALAPSLQYLTGLKEL